MKLKVSSLIRILLSISLPLLIWGFVIEPAQLFQTDVKVNRWTGPSLRIAFFSDLHAGSPHIDEEYISDLVDRINNQSPDVILIGGDLAINNVVGGHAMDFQKVAALLRKLKAPLGIYFVLGNHDWWNDSDLIRKSLIENGIQVLENNAMKIKFGADYYFWLVGIGDAFTHHADVTKALSLVNTKDPQILFMHDPAAIFQTKNNFFLALAGHMHGGQVYIPGIGAILTPGAAPKSWAQGKIDFKYGTLFVSRGVGTSILPVRINAPPEYVILDLK